MYTWNTKWIKAYESPWGLREKFKFANQLTEAELRKILGYSLIDTSCSVSSHISVLNHLTNLISISSTKSIEQTYINHTLQHLSYHDDINKYFNPFLNYCPKCLAKGYHSWLHQLIFIQECPFHSVTLEEKCPLCGQFIPLDLNFSHKLAAFTCSCGYCFLKFNSYSNLLSSWTDETDEINNKNIYSFLKYFDNLCMYHTYYYHYNNYNTLSGYRNLNLAFGSLKFRVLTTMDSSTLSISSRQLTHNEALKKLLKIYQQSCQCIGKFIRRKQPYFNTIHTKQTSRSSEDPQFALKRKITGTCIYKYISNEIETYIAAYKQQEQVCFEDYGVIVGALERIIGIILLKYYNSCLEYALKMKETSPNDIINFKASIPLSLDEFLIKYNNDSQLSKLILLKNIT